MIDEFLSALFIFSGIYIFYVSGLESIDKKRRTIYENIKEQQESKSRAGQNEKLVEMKQ